MKVDGLGVILAIILLPIIIVVTYYIQMQVDTIATENSYNTKLLNATYDAMSAFEINTANEKLSSNADSMRSLILASNNIFLNTLATNLGISNASKEYLQPYIPAVLYTMYDGYYIYAPTETLQVAEDVELEDNGLIKKKGYLYVGSTGVQHSSGDDYTYRLGNDGKANGNASYKDANASDYGDILYKKENTEYKYAKNTSYTFTSNPEEAQKDSDYILKSYVQYSARYVRGNKDITINYTLDNYLNIVGTIDKIYYTKTGYLIKENLVQSADIDGSYDLKKNNEEDATNKILGLEKNANGVSMEAAKFVSVGLENGIKIEAKWDNILGALNDDIIEITKLDRNITTISEVEERLQKIYEKCEDKTINDTQKEQLLNCIQTLEYEIQNYKSAAYYVSSACFSNWVYANLSDLTYDDVQDKAMREYYKNNSYTSTSGVRDFSDLYYDFHSNDEIKQRTIFKDSQHSDPEDTESNFNTHKMEVIKNSIKYNLNLSMSAYKNIYSEYEASLPVLLDEEWDKILSNISIVSFMQGWDCGLAIYNNYQIVSSTNNELTVTPDEIYYVKKGEFNKKEGSYHRIDCPYFLESGAGGDEYISFKSKEVKYDKVYDKPTGLYTFDHKNLACYTCINTNNYDSLFKSKEDTFYTNGKRYTSYYDRISSLTSANKMKAGYIGLAKERQDTYKTNALPVSEGYQVFNASRGSSESGILEGLTVENLPNVTELQITLEVDTTRTKPKQVGRSSLQVLTLSFNSLSGGTAVKGDIRLKQSGEQTVVLDITGCNWTGNSISIGPNNYEEVREHYVYYKVKSIKAIYR